MDIKRDMKPNGAPKRVAPLTVLLLAASSIFLLRSIGIPLLGQHSTPTSHPLSTVGTMSVAAALSLNSSVSGWHPPKSTWITDLDDVINGTGVHGFVFNGSQLPDGVPYGTYNWCNMPHVRASEYPKLASDEYQLEYVEVIHRHHKRTPYASNTFPVEPYPWSCSDSGLFYSGAPLNPQGNASARTYWSVYTSPSNPFSASGFNGTCQFPQLTRGGLDDSWQHGRDLWGVYHDLLSFLPSDDPLSAMEFRVTNNVITSQVASMLIAGMLSRSSPRSSQDDDDDDDAAAAPPAASLPDAAPIPLKVQPSSIDSLEPTYPCPAASALLSLYGPGSNASSSSSLWHAHLAASRPLFAALDALSGVAPDTNSTNADEWHQSWDHYFDNLSARLCHAKPLPCNGSSSNDSSRSSANANDDDDDDDDREEEEKEEEEKEKQHCVTAAQAASVFRLGQHEYATVWRAAPEGLAVAAAAYGVWVAEVAANIRAAVAAATIGKRGPAPAGAVRYRHNVAHDGSVARLLALLQVDVMVWPGMGAEVVFEVYTKKRAEKEREEETEAETETGEGKGKGEGDKKAYVRVLWGGRVLRSSHPHLGGALDGMLDADVLLAYLDGLVGEGASRVPGLCGSE
ncbi:histidine acid phosphatase [Diplodia corticola]|uniref:Histidine acid phosphatase n=1 Tax=Diplodia corticola TaxID=236234 RepID=A0A1J9R9Z4_9PEZI|nr:histidine acid phosphatase [Diplodia corticola]OJD37360.1 histidine acid phosphatase [Diplodia corticola]